MNRVKKYDNKRITHINFSMFTALSLSLSQCLFFFLFIAVTCSRFVRYFSFSLVCMSHTEMDVPTLGQTLEFIGKSFTTIFSFSFSLCQLLGILHEFSQLHKIDKKKKYNNFLHFLHMFSMQERLVYSELSK